MGTNIVAAVAAKQQSSSSFLPLLIIVVLFGVFYFAIIRPQRNRQRQAQATQRQAMPGQRIRTTAGMYGTVVSGDDRDVTIEISPGVQVTMLRRAIMEVVPEDDGAGTTPSQPDAETTSSTSSSSEEKKSSDDRGDLAI